MPVLRGGAVSYERGTPVDPRGPAPFAYMQLRLQVDLAHKKQLPPRILHLKPFDGPGGVGISYERGAPAACALLPEAAALWLQQQHLQGFLARRNPPPRRTLP